MKHLVLVLLLLTLILLELWFLESFLPYDWRHPISDSFHRLFPPTPYPPHNVALEFEMFLRDHLFWRIASYAITALFAIANAFLISKVWKTLRTT